MSMKLYEMSAQYREIERLLDGAEGEDAIEALTIALDELEEDIDGKLLSIGKLIESYHAEAAAIKAVADRQAKRAKAATRSAEWLEEYALRTMRATNRPKIVSTELTMRIKRGTGAVEITDESAIEERFVDVVTSRVVRKADLRTALLAMKGDGDESPALPGARLVFNEKLEVK